MDRRLIILIGFGAVLAATVAIVLVGRGGNSSGGSISTDTSTKPDVSAPGGDPPAELEVEDVVEGDGEAAQSGDDVEVQYVGVDFETGEEFDSSWEREPFSFELGAGEVIPGWDQGVEGMKVGGRRRLVVPPDLAYGPTGQPPAIGPNATLVFVVDLKSVE